MDWIMDICIGMSPIESFFTIGVLAELENDGI